MQDKLLTFNEFVKTRKLMTCKDYNEKYNYMFDDLETQIYVYGLESEGGHIEINTEKSWLSDEPFQKYCLNLCNESNATNHLDDLELRLYEDWYLSEHNNYNYPTEFDLNNCCEHQRYFSQDCDDCEKPNSNTIKVLDEIKSCLQSDIFNADDTNAEFSNSKMQIEISNAIKLITERK